MGVLNFCPPFFKIADLSLREVHITPDGLKSRRMVVDKNNEREYVTQRY